MARAFLVVMDSVGIGGAPDAHGFFNGTVPDSGANTIGHIAQACTEGRADEGRYGHLNVPHMMAMGLGRAVELASGVRIHGWDRPVTGAWGAATEISRGKDTPSGHWELAGLPVPWAWHYFDDVTNSFPDDLVDQLASLAGTTGILGNCHAPGTAIIEELGAQHIASGLPICYTSADSVLQIAAHEQSFGLARLLDLCARVAPVVHEMKVGRVIARPFSGSAEAGFVRTPNRRDFAITPPGPVLSNWVQDAGRRTYAVGKIGDIFSMAGFNEVRKGTDAELMIHLNDLVETAEDGSLTFANFVEFDSVYGHRRDVAGYARALEWFDMEIGKVIGKLRADDLLVLTEDHGNDPTWVGTDHTRERAPVLMSGRGRGSVGQIGFRDVAGLIAGHLGVPVRR